MNIDDLAIKSANTQGGGLVPSSTGLTPDALPEVQKNSFGRELKHRGTTKNALSGTGNDHSSASKTEDSHWYALRTTYGREKKAYDYIISKGGTAFYPTLSIVRLVDGKRKTVEESRLPNIFFAYGTEEEIKSFVYDNVNLPYLRFYYRYFHISKKVEKEPLIVSNNQIESLRIICKADADDIIVSIDEVQKFQKGQAVRILKGNTRGGVTGIVARYQGQQRVGIVIDGLLTMATACIPNAFIEIVKK
ncbi:MULTISPECIES: UpxY family transcription antiterminator [Bacteroidales]|nr:UpxY family transcription antiterminator [Phocaeicola vulgatus]RHC17193.1 UpxY family transcription antiterminator [Phocaeicola vulgatus]